MAGGFCEFGACGQEDLRFELEAGVKVEGDAAAIFGVGAAEFANDAILQLEFFTIKVVDNKIEGDEFLLVVDVEAVRLKNDGIMLNDFFEVTAHGLVGFGLTIFGVDADGERNIVSRERALRDFAGQAMDVFRGEAVRDLNMNRTHVGAGAVIVKDEVISTTNLRKTADEGVEFAGEPRVAAAADDVEDGIAEDFEAGFDNEQGDDDAEDAVETDLEKHGRENAD